MRQREGERKATVSVGRSMGAQGGLDKVRLNANAAMRLGIS